MSKFSPGLPHPQTQTQTNTLGTSWTDVFKAVWMPLQMCVSCFRHSSRSGWPSQHMWFIRFSKCLSDADQFFYSCLILTEMWKSFSALTKSLVKKKQVTAGEVDTWRKQLGKCAHQWTTNDEKNKQALSTLGVFFRLKKKDRQQQKGDRSREEERREGGNQTASFSSVLFSASFFLLLLSVFLL